MHGSTQGFRPLSGGPDVGKNVGNGVLRCRPLVY